MRTVEFAALSFAAFSACGPEPEPTSITEAPLPRWEVSSEPVFHLGVLEGDQHLQFFRISGLARLGDDRLVVANSGTQELRYFDAAGRFLDQGGGYGEGPGEFKFLRTIHALGPDSLIAFEGMWRAQYFDASGNYLHSVLLEDIRADVAPRDLWLYRRNLVDGLPPGGDVAMTKRFLARLPPPVEEPWYWYVRFDSAGYIWVSDDLMPGRERSDWTIVDSTGMAVARVTLPPRFEMFEATDDDVLGRWRDENDVEYVRIYALRKPPPGTGPPPDPLLLDTAISVAAAQIAPETFNMVRGMLRQMVTAQEAYFMDHRTYTSNRHDLAWEPPEGMIIDIISATGRGWLVVIAGSELPVICGNAVGAHTPRGWTEGVPFCPDIE